MDAMSWYAIYNNLTLHGRVERPPLQLAAVLVYESRLFPIPLI